MVFPTFYQKVPGAEPIDFDGVNDKPHPQCQSIMGSSVNRRPLLTYLVAVILLSSVLLNVLGLAFFVGALPSRSLSKRSPFGSWQTNGIAPERLTVDLC